MTLAHCLQQAPGRPRTCRRRTAAMTWRARAQGRVRSAQTASRSRRTRPPATAPPPRPPPRLSWGGPPAARPLTAMPQPRLASRTWTSPVYRVRSSPPGTVSPHRPSVQWCAGCAIGWTVACCLCGPHARVHMGQEMPFQKALMMRRRRQERSIGAIGAHGCIAYLHECCAVQMMRPWHRPQGAVGSEGIPQTVRRSCWQKHLDKWPRRRNAESLLSVLTWLNLVRIWLGRVFFSW